MFSPLCNNTPYPLPNCGNCHMYVLISAAVLITYNVKIIELKLLLNVYVYFYLDFFIPDMFCSVANLLVEFVLYMIIYFNI